MKLVIREYKDDSLLARHTLGLSDAIVILENIKTTRLELQALKQGATLKRIEGLDYSSTYQIEL